MYTLINYYEGVKNAKQKAMYCLILGEDEYQENKIFITLGFCQGISLKNITSNWILQLKV